MAAAAAAGTVGDLGVGRDGRSNGSEGEGDGGGKKEVAGVENDVAGCCCCVVDVAVAFKRRFSLPVPLDKAVDTELLGQGQARHGQTKDKAEEKPTQKR